MNVDTSPADPTDLLHRLDVSRFPIVHYSGPAVVSDEEMRAVFDVTLGYRRKGQPFVLLMDLRKTEKLTPTQRRMITDAVGDDETPHTCAGCALVFSSTALKHILTAIFWFRKPPYETRVFNGLPEARAWVEAQAAVLGRDGSPEQ